MDQFPYSDWTYSMGRMLPPGGSVRGERANLKGLVLGGGGGGRPDSAVSKPNFASKYSLESSRRDLHNALLCTLFESQFFRQTIAKFSSFFSQFLLFFRDFARFFRNFVKISPEFLEISRKSMKFANFHEF